MIFQIKTKIRLRAPSSNGSISKSEDVMKKHIASSCEISSPPALPTRTRICCPIQMFWKYALRRIPTINTSQNLPSLGDNNFELSVEDESVVFSINFVLRLIHSPDAYNRFLLYSLKRFENFLPQNKQID